MVEKYSGKVLSSLCNLILKTNIIVKSLSFLKDNLNLPTASAKPLYQSYSSRSLLWYFLTGKFINLIPLW